jgi:hypothetical protein
MVHRPSDSRILSVLIQSEHAYSKSLLDLLSASQSSLASFSAYAAASAPATSHAILAVAGSIAGADQALSRYAHAVDLWRHDLDALKKAEDELDHVIRDREILCVSPPPASALIVIDGTHFSAVSRVSSRRPRRKSRRATRSCSPPPPRAAQRPPRSRRSPS